MRSKERIKQVVFAIMAGVLIIGALPQINARAASRKNKRPGQVEISGIFQTGTNSIKISWNKPSRASGYQVKMTDIYGKTTNLGKTRKRSITVDKLTTREAYQFKVRAYNKYGNGKYSPVKSVSLRESIKYTADFDGNGTKSDIEIVPMADLEGEDYFEGLAIYKSGSKYSFLTDADDSYYKYKIAVKSIDGKALILLKTITDDDYTQIYAFDCSGDTVSMAADFSNNSHMWTSKLQLKGNTITAYYWNSFGPGMGIFNAERSYKYDGKSFIPLREYYDFDGLDMYDSLNEEYVLRTGPYRVAHSFKIYSDKECTDYIEKVPKGSYVKISRIYVSPDYNGADKGIESVYVESDDYTGWYSSKDYNKAEGKLGGDTYFDGSIAVG